MRISFGSLAKILLCITLLLAVFLRFNVSKVWPYFRHATAAPIILALGLAVGQVLVTSARWHFLLRALGVRLPIRKTIEANIVSIFANSLLINGIGGLATRAGYLAQYDVPVHRSLSTSLLERVVVAVVLLTMTIIGLWDVGFGVALRNPMTPKIAAGLSVAGAAILVVLIAMPAGWRRYLRTVKSAVAATIRDMATLAVSPACLSGAFALTIVSQFMLVGTGILAGEFMGVSVPLMQLGFILPGIALISSLPITIGGFGLRELSSVVLMGALGIPLEQAVVISMLIGIVSLLGAVLAMLGVVVLRWAQKSPEWA